MSDGERRSTPRGVRRRAQLRAAATALIQERGYERVSVSELAEAADISVGGLYRHIKGKSDLLVMACEDIYGDLRERIVDAAAQEQGYAEKLRAAVHVYLDACQENRERILLLYREYRYLPPDAGQRYMDREQAIAGVFADIIRVGVRVGAFGNCDPFVVAHDIVLLGHLPALKGWAVRDRLSGEALTQQQTDLLLRALVVSGHSASHRGRDQ